METRHIRQSRWRPPSQLLANNAELSGIQTVRCREHLLNHQSSSPTAADTDVTTQQKQLISFTLNLCLDLTKNVQFSERKSVTNVPPKGFSFLFCDSTKDILLVEMWKL